MRKDREGRKSRQGGQHGNETAPLAIKPRPAPHKSKLETLEEQIDECLTYARSLGHEGLEVDVIFHLRKARNGVVWKMGVSE